MIDNQTSKYSLEDLISIFEEKNSKESELTKLTLVKSNKNSSLLDKLLSRIEGLNSWNKIAGELMDIYIFIYGSPAAYPALGQIYKLCGSGQDTVIFLLKYAWAVHRFPRDKDTQSLLIGYAKHEANKKGKPAQEVSDPVWEKRRNKFT